MCHKGPRGLVWGASAVLVGTLQSARVMSARLAAARVMSARLAAAFCTAPLHRPSSLRLHCACLLLLLLLLQVMLWEHRKAGMDLRVRPVKSSELPAWITQAAAAAMTGRTSSSNGEQQPEDGAGQQGRSEHEALQLCWPTAPKSQHAGVGMHAATIGLLCRWRGCMQCLQQPFASDIPS